MNISFFARPYFLALDPSISAEPAMARLAGLVRGEQMADYLGGKYNPTNAFENDLKIYIKPKTLDNITDDDYIDVSDAGDYLIELLKKRPKIKLLASSQVLYDYLKEKLINEVFFIPEHHCNFERAKRNRVEMTTAGFVGAPSLLNFAANDKITNELEKIGVEYKPYYYFKSRQDVTDFYKQIDLLIVADFEWVDDSEAYRHPTKLISAASFGIPAIARYKIGYKEFEDNYIPVNDMKSLVVEVEKFKNLDYYNAFAKKIIDAAEPYNIENIAKLYRRLTLKQ
jgi:hypothetical protein